MTGSQDLLWDTDVNSRLSFHCRLLSFEIAMISLYSRTFDQSTWNRSLWVTVRERLMRFLALSGGGGSDCRWARREFESRRIRPWLIRWLERREAAQECEWVSSEGSEGCWACQGVFSQTSPCPLCLTPLYGSFMAPPYCSRPDSPLPPSAPSLGLRLGQLALFLNTGSRQHCLKRASLWRRHSRTLVRHRRGR